MCWLACIGSLVWIGFLDICFWNWGRAMLPLPPPAAVLAARFLQGCCRQNGKQDHFFPPVAVRLFVFIFCLILIFYALGAARPSLSGGRKGQKTAEGEPFRWVPLRKPLLTDQRQHFRPPPVADEGRKWWATPASAAGGGYSEQGLAQRYRAIRRDSEKRDNIARGQATA